MYHALLAVVLVGSTLTVSSAKDCIDPLGMQNGGITDDQLTASSAFHTGLTEAKSGRLENDQDGGGWCPKATTFTMNSSSGVFQEYIQVDLRSTFRFTGISTQGRWGVNASEFASVYRLFYTRDDLDKKVTWMPVIDENYEIINFTGNVDASNIYSNRIAFPPIVRAVRIHPHLKSTPVCMRLELYGCPFDSGVLSYNTQRGNNRDKYKFYDFSYDGNIDATSYSNGLGILVDGQVGDSNYRQKNGQGWLGWRQAQTPLPQIIFTFDTIRTFSSVEFICNVNTKKNIHIFKAVNISFSQDGSRYTRMVNHTTQQVDSADSNGINSNVTLQLCGNVGRYVKVDFEYEGVWILLGEVSFISDVVKNISSVPEPKCGVVIPVDDNEGKHAAADAGSDSEGSSAGMIAGIVCGVLVVIMILVALILWRRNQIPQKRHQQLSRLDRFVHVEFRRQESHNRPPSQIECYAETGPSTTERNHKGKGACANGDITPTPIYASISDNLHKLVKTTPEHRPLLQSTSSSKSGTIPNGPGPYIATGSTPHHSSSSSGNSGQESYYAEPDTPKPQASPAPLGYADPIDAITPTRKVSDFFKNPIYAEALYASPYQSASGTSLYACPNAETQHKNDKKFVEFPRDKLVLKEKIGDGQFGEVHVCEAQGLGVLLGKDVEEDEKMLVAVKMLKSDVSKTTKTDFFKEAKTMAGLEHDNVVQLLAICKDDPMCIIVEYMSNGDLSQFLRGHRFANEEPNHYENTSKEIEYQTLLYMIVQIAAGMEYISSLKYIHRDLACRNCLVGDAFSVKIGDFGMARHMYSKQYYRIQGRAVLPIRWMAPECIMQGTFTTESDIWAFGVTVWEVLTLAKDYPLAVYTDEQVIENIQNIFLGLSETCFYPEQPDNCPDDIYSMIRMCWSREPDARPSFKFLHQFFRQKVDYSVGDI